MKVLHVNLRHMAGVDVIVSRADLVHLSRNNFNTYIYIYINPSPKPRNPNNKHLYI